MKVESGIYLLFRAGSRPPSSIRQQIEGTPLYADRAEGSILNNICRHKATNVSEIVKLPNKNRVFAVLTGLQPPIVPRQRIDIIQGVTHGKTKPDPICELHARS
jgi:hypothetical protein